MILWFIPDNYCLGNIVLHTRAPMHARPCTRAHARAPMHARPCTRAHARPPTHSRAQTCDHTHAPANAERQPTYKHSILVENKIFVTICYLVGLKSLICGRRYMYAPSY